MCGFAGFTGFNACADDVLRKMTDTLRHRGPDDEGYFSDAFVSLGFRRLAIIDLSEAGRQPFLSADKNLAVVFNGEIYNYKELRADLAAKGHTFKTQTDTEVLIHSYEEYGREMLDFLRGMFAFVLYDKKNGELFCARDFFGIKPFYYALVDGELIFASEIKAMLRYPNFPKELNSAALEHYLSFQYSVLPETFFKGVFKLMPGHFLVFKAGRVSVTKYFTPEFSPNGALNEETAVPLIDEALKDSVSAHMISDVEVGSFLSSGVDSSLIAVLSKCAKTFTVGFDYDKYSEIAFAKSLTEKIGAENFSESISKDDYWNILPKIMYHMDEPLADPSAVALYFVAQNAARRVKVALSGEAADEFFGGYNIYKEPIDLAFYTRLPQAARKFAAAAALAVPFGFKGKNFLIRASKPVEQRFIGNAYIFTKKERGAVLKTGAAQSEPSYVTRPYYNEAKHADDVTKMQQLDINLWLQGDILLKADKMSMAHSLEVRVPYVDKHVFSLCKTLPTHLRVNKKGTKTAFRESAKKILPESTALKKKLGFPVPIRLWLREEAFYAKVKDAFLSGAAKQFFNTDAIMALLDAHKNKKRDNSRKIWTVYMFLVWYGVFFGENGA